MGRSDGPHRQLCPGVDGTRDVRFRRWAGGCLGATNGHLLGAREDVARRRALHRRQGARKSSRRRSDGPDLRESGGAKRQTGSARCRQGHSGNVRPHGHERRGDCCADCWRPYLWQSPWCCAGGSIRRSRPRGRQPRGARSWLEEHFWNRQRRRHDHQRPGGRLDHQPGEVGQRLLRQPVRLRVGTGEGFGRCVAVDSQGCSGTGHGAGCSTISRRSTPR